MTEYTEEQINDMLVNARTEQANFEHWRIAKDSGFRIGMAAITQSVNSGLVDREVFNVWDAEYKQFRAEFFPQVQQQKPQQKKSEDESAE